MGTEEIPAPASSARPTLRDVGKLAGVSYRTVSRVMNGDRFVAPATAETVRRAADELGFQRNDIARMLRQGSSTMTIGLVIEDMSNPFYAAFCQHVAAAALHHGYVLLTASGEHDPATEREVVDAFLRRRVDALIVFPSSDDYHYLQPEIRRGTPLVFVDAPGAGLETDVVTMDNRAGVRAGVTHLLAQGHQRIALLVEDLRLEVARERREGYLEALAAAGRVVEERLIRTGLRTTADAAAAAADLLAMDARSRPTAIFAANNRLTVGAFGAIKTISDGFSSALVGFGDFETAELLEPAVTVVRQDPSTMADAVVDLLFPRLLSSQNEAPRHVQLPMQLVLRGSGELSPA